MESLEGILQMCSEERISMNQMSYQCSNLSPGSVSVTKIFFFLTTNVKFVVIPKRQAIYKSYSITVTIIVIIVLSNLCHQAQL